MQLVTQNRSTSFFLAQDKKKKPVKALSEPNHLICIGKTGCSYFPLGFQAELDKGQTGADWCVILISQLTAQLPQTVNPGLQNNLV